ncbi:hypothetical protein XAPC_1528 [Xanthomonas citri pv. punicae str. LMG 859]|nr:hypothetical protein XAPC_1528 [Xanthomonas citri pv. punicae str. LMG 859]
MAVRYLQKLGSACTSRAPLPASFAHRSARCRTKRAGCNAWSGPSMRVRMCAAPNGILAQSIGASP